MDALILLLLLLSDRLWTGSASVLTRQLGSLLLGCLSPPEALGPIRGYLLGDVCWALGLANVAVGKISVSTS